TKLEEQKKLGREMSIRPQPTIQYRAVRTLVQADKAAMIASMRDPKDPNRHGDVTIRFVKETGAWKVADESWSDTAVDPASIYAVLPPEDGAFARAGSSWDRIAAAAGNTKYFRPDQLQWKLRATSDESFLYIRIEAAGELPAPNTEVRGEFADLRSPVQR